MTRLIPVGDRAWVDPDHVRFIQWSAPRHPTEDHITGVQLNAAVTLETYHKVYRIPCATIEDAQAIVRDVMAEISARELSRIAAAALPPSMIRATR